MNPLKQLTIVAFMCYSHATLSMRNLQYDERSLILQNQKWLEEQLAQQNNPELTNEVINDLSEYFFTRTDRFYRDLDRSNKVINTDLLNEKISAAMSRIMKAVASVKDKKTKQLDSTDIIEELLDENKKPLYFGDVDQFPST